MATNFIRWFEDIGAGDTGSVGGKNASLGESSDRNLTPLFQKQSHSIT
jgi:phosphoenolpyruvate synthase/pyruvate phosphate dikinase